MTAAVIAIFFAATGLLSIAAICVFVSKQRSRRTPEPARRTSRGNMNQTKPANVFSEPCTNNPPTEAFAERPKSYSSKSYQDRKARGMPVGKVYGPGHAVGRKGSKESFASQDSQSTTSTETPPSEGTRSPASEEPVHASPAKRNRDAKVYPEPDGHQPPPPPMPQQFRSASFAASEGNANRSSSKSPAGSKEQQQPSAPVPRRSEHAPAPPQRPSPKAEPKVESKPDVKAAAAAAEAARHQRENQMQRDKEEEAARDKEEVRAGLRAAAAAHKEKQHQQQQRAAEPSGAGPSQPQANPPAPRSKQKASSSGKYAGWTFGRSAGANASVPKQTPPAAPTPKARPQRSQSAPPAAAKSSWFGGSGPSASATDKATEKKATSLSADMMKRLDNARSKPIEERKKIFKDLQRELHPDKNIGQAEAAKTAFQKLMEQRGPFLSD